MFVCDLYRNAAFILHTDGSRLVVSLDPARTIQMRLTDNLSLGPITVDVGDPTGNHRAAIAKPSATANLTWPVRPPSGRARPATITASGA